MKNTFPHFYHSCAATPLAHTCTKKTVEITQSTKYAQAPSNDCPSQEDQTKPTHAQNVWYVQFSTYEIVGLFGLERKKGSV